jgi:hypothetical protein
MSLATAQVFIGCASIGARNNLSKECVEGDAKHSGGVLERPDNGVRQAHFHLSPWAKFGTFAFIRRSSQLSGQLV